MPFRPTSSHRVYAIAAAPIAALHLASPTVGAALMAGLGGAHLLRELLARRKP